MLQSNTQFCDDSLSLPFTVMLSSIEATAPTASRTTIGSAIVPFRLPAVMRTLQLELPSAMIEASKPGNSEVSDASCSVSSSGRTPPPATTVTISELVPTVVTTLGSGCRLTAFAAAAEIRNSDERQSDVRKQTPPLSEEPW